MIDEATASRIASFREAHCDPEAWNFISTALHNGDFYYFLCLLRFFRKSRAGGRPVRLFAVTRQHFALASLFADHVDRLEYTPEANFSGDQISAWRVQQGQADFVPGVLINVFPLNYFFKPLEFGDLWFLLNTHGISFIHLFKLIMRVPMNIAPDIPIVSEISRAAAAELCERHELIPGKTLILFPYGQSIRQDQTVTQLYFSALAESAAANGLHVVTSIAGQETAIAGTRGIFIPFDLVIPLCELAGYTLSFRSGICEALAAARCVKVCVYTNQNIADEHSVIAYGLGGTERSLVCDLLSHADPTDFAERAVRALVGPALNDGSLYIPRRALELLSLALSQEPPNGRFGRAEFIIRHDWGSVFTSGVLGDGWSGPDGDGIFNQGYRSVVYLKPAIPAWFPTDDVKGRTVTLCIDLMLAIAADIHENLMYSIEINDVRTSYQTHWPNGNQTFCFPLDADTAAAPIRLTLFVENPISIQELSGGRTHDTRIVGFKLTKAAYELAEEAG